MLLSIPDDAIAQIEAIIADTETAAKVVAVVGTIMPTDTRYNGHANYETWVMSMYLDGNYTGEYTCRHYESMVSSVVEDIAEEISEDTPSDEAIDSAVYSLAENLKSNVESEIYGDDDSLSSGIVGDFLGAALSEVDWSEIARSRVEDAM